MLLLISILITFLVIFIIIHFKDYHLHITNDCDRLGPQKFHTHAAPRIGGIGIYIALLIVCIIIFFKKNIDLFELLLLSLLSAFPVFFAGTFEDLTKKVSIKIRLFAGVVSSLIFLYLFNITTIRTDIWLLDALLINNWVATLFLVFACSGLSNAYNIIDGFNGLAATVAILAGLAIAHVAFEVNDTQLTYVSLVFTGSMFGFLLWNFPKGHIFLGDGGAYFAGFIISMFSVLLVTRNQTVSPWFVLLINGYPFFETIFTIWRRYLLKGRSPGQPDGIHLHSLMYRRIIKKSKPQNKYKKDFRLNNARTSFYMVGLSFIAIGPAVLYWDNTKYLIICTLLFFIIYIYIYRGIVRFKTPKWLHSLNEKL
jgi:UDP-GlcNAc:undecaprenyl-phosphate GlcNAc-1-phosphate transferase